MNRCEKPSVVSQSETAHRSQALPRLADVSNLVLKSCTFLSGSVKVNKRFSGLFLLIFNDLINF